MTASRRLSMIRPTLYCPREGPTNASVPRVCMKTVVAPVSSPIAALDVWRPAVKADRHVIGSAFGRTGSAVAHPVPTGESVRDMGTRLELLGRTFMAVRIL